MPSLLLNGETTTFSDEQFPQTVGDLLAWMQVDAAGVVVEVQGAVLSRNGMATHPLQPEDRVEVVQFVGGG